jgi:hypothetical protein
MSMTLDEWSWAGVSRRRPEVESTIVVLNRDDTGRRRTLRCSMVGTAAVRGGDAAPDKSLGSKPTFPVDPGRHEAGLNWRI